MHDLVVEDRRIRFDVDSSALDGVLRALVAGGVRSLTATPPTLEELFLRHYGDHVDEAPQSITVSTTASASKSASKSTSKSTTAADPTAAPKQHKAAAR